MKLSEDTNAILKNFSGINPSILLKPGNVIETISPQKTVMARATVSDNVEGRAAIYDLSKFLSITSVFDDPEIEFGENRFTISSGKRKVFYTYADEKMIIVPPENNVVLPSTEAVFKVTWNDIQSVIRAAGILQLGDISFIGDGSKIIISANDVKNPTADAFEVEVAEYDGSQFDMHVKVENLKLIPTDYEITLCAAGMSRFKATSVQYWIAAQSK